MTKSDKWKKEFHKALIDAFVNNGTPVDESGRDTFYGYIAHNWQEICTETHEVGIDYDKSTFTEAEWEAFQGTFYEGDTRKVGLDATIMLKNGRRHVFRYDGTVSDLILAVAGE